MGRFGGMGPSEPSWAPDQELMGLLLAGGAPKTRANGVHLETIGPVGKDGALTQDSKKL